MGLWCTHTTAILHAQGYRNWKSVFRIEQIIEYFHIHSVAKCSKNTFSMWAFDIKQWMPESSQLSPVSCSHTAFPQMWSRFMRLANFYTQTLLEWVVQSANVEHDGHLMQSDPCADLRWTVNTRQLLWLTIGSLETTNSSPCNRIHICLILKTGMQIIHQHWAWYEYGNLISPGKDL